MATNIVQAAFCRESTLFQHGQRVMGSTIKLVRRATYGVICRKIEEWMLSAELRLIAVKSELKFIARSNSKTFIQHKHVILIYVQQILPWFTIDQKHYKKGQQDTLLSFIFSKIIFNNITITALHFHWEANYCLNYWSSLSLYTVFLERDRVTYWVDSAHQEPTGCILHCLPCLGKSSKSNLRKKFQLTCNE